MKDDLKDIWLGLCGAAHAAWELFVDWWDIASAKQRYILLGVCVVLLLLLSTCAWGDTGARYKHGSVMAMVQFPHQGLVFACPMENEITVTNRIYLCLMLRPMPDGYLLSDGQAAYCAQIRVNDNGDPAYDCGPWDFIQEKMAEAKGI